MAHKLAREPQGPVSLHLPIGKLFTKGATTQILRSFFLGGGDVGDAKALT